MKPSDRENRKIRLQVFLSHSGQCSRRKAMDLIFKRQVTVNNQIVTEPSTPIDSDKDRVCLKGKIVEIKSHVYIMLNKPKGYITTVADWHAEKTVLDLLPQGFKNLYPVGRLDKDTDGLLLLTNDGDIAYELTHPKFNIDKTYFVEIRGDLKGREQKQLEEGVILDNKRTAPCKITKIENTGGKSSFCVTIHEGRKRQIRRMLGAIKHCVLSLKRIKQGPLSLGNLATGKWRQLDSKEIFALKNL